MAEPATLERGYRMRCYPTVRQRRVLERLFGASRFVWNWALERRSTAYQVDGTRLDWVSLSREFTQLRHAEQTCWLAELPREPFNQVLRDQERAFKNFFSRRARYPRFRCRGTHLTVRFTLDQRRIQVDREVTRRRAYVSLPGLGRVKLRRSEKLLGRLRSVTLSRDGAGRYFASICADEVPRCAWPAAKNIRAEGLRLYGATLSPATGERPGSDARGVACAAPPLLRATAAPARRRPTRNREPARRSVRTETRRVLSGTARRRVRAGL